MSDGLLNILIGLSIGCIFPAAVFVVLWITGGLNRGGERSIVEQAADLAENLANDRPRLAIYVPPADDANGAGDAGDGAGDADSFAELDTEGVRYLNWYTQRSC
jgi:hypothetical protein